MRAVSFAVLFAAAVACENDTTVIPVTVQWMDWPADVVSNEPFSVRMIVYWPCAAQGFRPGPAADQSAVTFTPYFLGQDNNTYCALAEQVVSLVVGSLDTAGLAPGLAAEFSRSYEMRAATDVFVPEPRPFWTGPPIRMFGDVTVRPSPPTPPVPTPRRNAAGRVYTLRDSLGCLRIRPVGSYAPQAAIVLENPTDTIGLSGAFVRGYLHYPAAPVCGEARVFHLVSRN